MAMVIFLPSSLESCGGGEVFASSPQKERVMTMVTFLPSSCESGHGLSHHLLEKRGSTLLVLGRRW